jgi:cell division control protein 45
MTSGRSACIPDLAPLCSTETSSLTSSEFAIAFLDAKIKCNAEGTYQTHDTSVIQIKEDDLKLFLDTLCLGPE